MKHELPSIIEKQRRVSPAETPQALTWHAGALWMGARDLRRIYGIDPKTWTIFEENEPPGIPWAAVSTGDAIRFTIGEGPNDDRYVRRYVPGKSYAQALASDRFACPHFTGSYLSWDGEHLYLSQWYKHRILKLGAAGEIVRTIDVGAEISGHAFVNGMFYVLRGTEQNGESWSIARFDPRDETPQVTDLARMSFPCRSLAFDGKNFWSNYRAGNAIISFALPE